MEQIGCHHNNIAHAVVPMKLSVYLLDFSFVFSITYIMLLGTNTLSSHVHIYF